MAYSVEMVRITSDLSKKSRIIIMTCTKEVSAPMSPSDFQFNAADGFEEVNYMDGKDHRVCCPSHHNRVRRLMLTNRWDCS